ncbi:uro-adherence factor A [Syngnathus scovelli]|uniref:uro-adherence factor A n=1 Tax=Syngnathus scovelli TaxID=161590 RepID=UPI00210FD926|nr:uncharacterized protein LOC125988116 [Syngnathus scovelli]
MAEESSFPELEGLEKQLESLISSHSSDDLHGDSKTYCSNFCKLVEEYASRCRTPLPRLRILETALCHFTRASSFFTSCDHVLHTLSSLALSVFELLLFFNEQDFHEEPLKHFSIKFQECHVALLKHQNVHLLQVEPLLHSGGAWASTTLKAILSESSLPQNEVDRFLSSELPVFLELRVRYLLSCERVREALALAKCCIRHPMAGKHLFFLQVYLTWLYKTQYNQLLKEVADLTGKDAVHIICSLEYEETDQLLLALCQVFLSQQLCRGDMYYLWELVFVWSKLHKRLNTSKQAFLEESHRLMLSASNVSSVFPFVRVVIEELGADGVQFCVELCADALKSCLPCDINTKSLIYKTIAGLLPNDLEVCRACALLVFFLERSVGAYKMVYFLYMLPDQDYHVEHSPIRNQTRFETLQILKKDLYFDPEFWNLIALRTNCLKLMSEKVVDASLDELMEESWVPNYCAKDFPFVCSTSTANIDDGTAKRPCHNDGSHKEMSSEETPKKLKVVQGKTGLNDSNAVKKKAPDNGTAKNPNDGRHKEISSAESPKKLKLVQGKTRLNDSDAVKKKVNHRSRFTKEASSQPLRRSFWQLDRMHDIGSGQLRRATRLSAKDPPKRRIQKPKWLLEDSGNLQESKLRKRSLRTQRVHQSSALKRSENGRPKNSTQAKASENSCTKHETANSVEPASTPQIILELSLPDNELLGTFAEDGNKPKGCPPMLFYKPTLKLPDPSHPVKVLHGKEVILRARDETMLVQLLHCYARRPKGKGKGSNIHGSVSTITRSSAHGSSLKEPQSVLCEKPNAETRVGLSSEDAVTTEHPEKPSPVLPSLAKEPLESTEMKKIVYSEKIIALKGTEGSILGQTAHSLKTDKVHTTVASLELSDERSVEMKVTLASQSPAVEKVTQQPTTSSIDFSPTFDTLSKKIEDTEYTPSMSNTLPSQSSDSTCHTPLQGRQALVNTNEEQNPKPLSPHSENGKTFIDKAKDITEDAQNEHSNRMDDISALATETVTQFSPIEPLPDLENCKQPTDANAKQSVLQNESSFANASSQTVPEPSTTGNTQGNNHAAPAEYDDYEDDFEDDESIETEESKLEYCCTFCHKDFKGRRVVIHAMFHFRKDECMFCGTTFKDDLLAMMHLSDHIEKLKRSKEVASCKAQQTCESETKDFSQPKASAKANVPNSLSGHHHSRKLRNSSVCNKSLSHPEADLRLESRNLRSNDKAIDSQFVQKNEPNECIDGKSPESKVNGLFDKKNKFDQMKHTNSKAEDNQATPTHDTEDKADDRQLTHAMPNSCGSFASSVQKRKCVEGLKNNVIKDGKKAIQEKRLEPKVKIDCPADGCTWSTDLSKNRVALLYHALEHHYGDIKPLEMSLKVANNKCSICKRVLWSFEHFQHHVERHRLSPRHPCLHLGCTARFKTGNEMSRHARKHSPLQAVCCLPGCSKLFICLWALNLHEKEHYASKPIKPVKTVDLQTDHKTNCMQVKAVTSATEGSLSQSTRVLRRHASRDVTAKSASVPPPMAKGELKTRNESKHSNVLKNLSNKDTTAQSSNHSLNLRLRKGQTSEPRELPFSRRRLKLRHKFKKKQVRVNQTEMFPKTRGRPRKANKATHDENTTKRQNSQSLKGETPDGPETPTSPTVSTKLGINEKQEEVNDDDKILHQKSNSQESVSSCVEQKISLHRGAPLTAASRSSVVHALKLRVLNLRKRCASRSNEFLEASRAKKERLTLRKSPRRRSSLQAASREPAASTFTHAARRSGDEKGEKTHSSKSSPADLIPASTKVNVKKTRPKKKKTGKMLQIGDKKVDGTICPSLEKKSNEEHHNVTSDGSSSTTSDWNKTSNEEPSDATRSGSTSTVSNLERTSKEELSDVMSDGSGSTMSNLESVEEPSAVTSDSSSPTTQMSIKELSNVTCDGSTTITSNLESKSLEEPSHVTSDVSISTMPNLESKSMEEPSHVTSDVSISTMPNLESETTEEPSYVTSDDSSSTTSTVQAEPSSKKDVHVRRNKGAKAIKEGEVKSSRKRPHPDQRTAKIATESKTQASIGSEVKVGEADNCASEQLHVNKTPESVKDKRGQAKSKLAKEYDGSTLCMDTLAEYGKKHMRAPPTAYLDEKFTAMPKKRKEAASDIRTSLEEAPVTAAPQRHRCANCFTTFNSAEELQRHHHLQHCTNLFGFDSDDEGN